MPGENRLGVYSADEFLTRVSLLKTHSPDSLTLMPKDQKVIVVGGCNVDLYAAQCAKRLGADVTVVYPGLEKDLPARLDEVKRAKSIGIEFLFLTSLVRIAGDNDGWVSDIICQEMMPGAMNASGRQTVVPLYESDFAVKADCVILSRN